MAFQKATKKQAKGRMAIDGPSGSGKTFTALRIARALSPAGKIAVIDTERGSASKYADLFSFDVCEIVDDFHPKHYIEAMKDAEAAGYEVIVIDSLSHAWEGAGGVLELTDKAAARSKTGNSYTAWRETTPIHNQLINAMLQSKCHVIATMRSKTEYVLQEDDRGKKVPKKIGMAPVQRQGMEYEFDVVVDMDLEHRGIVAKTRCHALKDGVFMEPGENDLGKTFADWLNAGDEATLTTQDLHRFKQTVVDRLFHLGGDHDVASVGRSIVQAMGFKEAKEIPSNRLGEAIELASSWKPEEVAA